MVSTDLTRLERQARARYELGRLRRALLGALPLLPVSLIALCLSQRPASTLCLGLCSAALSVFLLWYGRDPQRAVLPGLAAGLIPLALSLCANQLHQCGPDGCSSFCAPACTLGGAVAGLAVASVGKRRKLGPWFWACSSLLALLTGAMGCSCVGYSGVLGLGVGYGLALLPAWLQRPKTTGVGSR
ncbi:MAG TPA: hypothetical protein VFS67_29505 [Polyangiaceae bacterium]|nr:hypothetical protein [Polyangiaceae bacterium]